MFSPLQTDDRGAGRWARGISAGVHLLFVGWCLHSPAATFLKPSFVVRGNGGTVVAHLYWSPSQIVSGATGSAEHPRLSWNPENMQNAGHKRSVQQHATHNLQTSLLPNGIASPVAGSPRGTIAEGPLSGDEVRPALPIVSSDPLVDASE